MTAGNGRLIEPKSGRAPATLSALLLPQSRRRPSGEQSADLMGMVHGCAADYGDSSTDVGASALTLQRAYAGALINRSLSNTANSHCHRHSQATMGFSV